MPQLTAAIFCGGKSSRMGCPKESIILPNGKMMIEHIYDQLSQHCSQVVLVGKPEKLPKKMSHLPQIHDRFKNIGPLGGLEALLASGMNNEYLVLPCDAHRLRGEVIELLLDFPKEETMVLAHDDKIEPLMARYCVSILDIVQEQIKRGKYSLHALLQRVSCQKVEVPKEYRLALSNANTWEDLQKLSHLRGKRRGRVRKGV